MIDVKISDNLVLFFIIYKFCDKLLFKKFFVEKINLYFIIVDYYNILWIIINEVIMFFKINSFL